MDIKITDDIIAAMEAIKESANIDGYGDEGAGYDYAQMARGFMEFLESKGMLVNPDTKNNDDTVCIIMHTPFDGWENIPPYVNAVFENESKARQYLNDNTGAYRGDYEMVEETIIK